MQKWEYLIASFGDTQYEQAGKWLSESGADGWELVSVAPRSIFGNTFWMNFYLKRPVEASDRANG